MKKGIQKSNPALALWQRVILDGRVHKLARNYREKLKMPIDGFNLPREYISWYKKYEKDSNTEKYFSDFIKESKKIIPYKGIIEEFDMEIILINLFCYNNTDDSFMEKAKYSGMEIEIIKDSKIFYPKLKEYVGEIKDGVYIKLKPFSTIDSIIKYVEENKFLIKKHLDAYSESINLAKPKRIKTSSHFKRDSMILALDEYSKKEIEENFNIKAEYKEMAICNLMKAMGEKRVTFDIVKAVKQRRKIK